MTPTVEKDNVQPAPPYGRETQNITTDTVRQGPAGWRVLYVLILGMGGAALACFVAYMIWTYVR
ncbi:MAG: hypothetical protein QM743_01855 [Chitinophagaceae bacterium]|uniref:hypothetical protein n=1 Tax=Labrys sp. (in: a-proteobacteria) TaxID=1917972 RepID=UPI0039E562E7